MSQEKKTIKSIDKTLSILECLDELGQCGVTEIAEYLGFSKGTVHHHLSTLEDHEYVVKEGSKYSLSLKLFEMGIGTRQRTEVYSIAKGDIDELAAETGEITNLMIEEHGRGVYLYISRGEKAVQLDTKMGTRQYLHTSALGKSILAYMPDSRYEEIIQQHGLPAETPNTVTEREVLETELDEIQAQGVAFDGEERAQGIRCVAAPITSNQGRLIGAVSVSGPSTRMKGSRFKEEIPEMVKGTATVIGLNVSFS